MWLYEPIVFHHSARLVELPSSVNSSYGMIPRQGLHAHLGSCTFSSCSSWYHRLQLSSTRYNWCNTKESHTNNFEIQRISIGVLTPFWIAQLFDLFIYCLCPCTYQPASTKTMRTPVYEGPVSTQASSYPNSPYSPQVTNAENIGVAALIIETMVCMGITLCSCE